MLAIVRGNNVIQLLDAESLREVARLEAPDPQGVVTWRSAPTVDVWRPLRRRMSSICGTCVDCVRGFRVWISIGTIRLSRLM